MLTHLREFFPSHSAMLGERQLRELVQNGIRMAAKHGITKRRDVCKYIDMITIFGESFDEFSWAREILDTELYPEEKIRGLVFAAKLRLATIKYPYA